MLSYLISSLQDSDLMMNLFVSLAVGASVLSIAWPYLMTDDYSDRMRSLAIERTTLRDKERVKLNKGSMKAKPKAWQTRLVDKFNLTKHFGQSEIKEKLSQAGMRSGTAYTTYLVAQFLSPICIGAFGFFYMFVLYESERGLNFRLITSLLILFFAYKLPSIYVANAMQKRVDSIRQAFPDALDLLLICVEAGMSVEVAMKRVGEEIGVQSVPLAEEFMLTTAELSYLPDRKQAYENLGKRVNLDGVKAVVLALTQAEKYGTPMGQALRVMAQENRDIRMSEAERKAASIPPKLTVPMIVFFLPVLFIVILGPPAIRVLKLD